MSAVYSLNVSILIQIIVNLNIVNLSAFFEYFIVSFCIHQKQLLEHLK